ncbi:MAG: hypothetical protein CR988_07710 [Treponema sp.]|nr:MAG: hypothetical protein CR988_07710 [Treponema sp.]
MKPPPSISRLERADAGFSKPASEIQFACHLHANLAVAIAEPRNEAVFKLRLLKKSLNLKICQKK